MPYILTQTPLLLTYLEKWHKQAFEKKELKGVTCQIHCTFLHLKLLCWVL